MPWRCYDDHAGSQGTPSVHCLSTACRGHLCLLFTQSDNWALVNELAQNGASLTSIDDRGHDLMMWAIRHDAVTVVKELLKRGVNPNAPPKELLALQSSLGFPTTAVGGAGGESIATASLSSTGARSLVWKPALHYAVENGRLRVSDLSRSKFRCPLSTVCSWHCPSSFPAVCEGVVESGRA